VTANNASSNNVQVATLYKLENSFNKANHIRCFNHTIQLSGKALIKPFNAGMGKVDSDLENGDDNVPSLEEFNHSNDTHDNANSGVLKEEEEDDNNNKLEKLSEEDQSRLLDDTSADREMVSKVGGFYFCLSDVGDMFFYSFGNFHLR
jgi:hypothetical protein